jgi:hypothetical protein
MCLFLDRGEWDLLSRADHVQTGLRLRASLNPDVRARTFSCVHVFAELDLDLDSRKKRHTEFFFGVKAWEYHLSRQEDHQTLNDS